MTGFVNEDQLEGADKPQRILLLKKWLDAGMDLGNHTYSPVSLSTTPVDAYIHDAICDETVTAPLLALYRKRERWFRCPYLETGETLEVRDKFESWLRNRRYRVAPVTMENSDWQFSGPYDAAVDRGDKRNAASMDELATILRHAKLRVISLDKAMRDPAYRIADTYVGPDGIEWLERWSKTLRRDLPWDSIPLVPQDIVANDAKLETSVGDSH